MDLQPIAALHPTWVPESGLLVLDLAHGKANEVGSAELDAFEALCELVEHAPELVCVLTTSHRRSERGTPIFVSGANVTERVGWDRSRVRDHVRRQRELMVRLRHLPVFTAVACHGIAFGWGLEYLLTADLAIATPSASFALPETGLGIVPGARGTAELAARVGVSQAMRLGAVGETLDAAEAHRIGLVAEVVADLDAAEHRIRSLADRLRKRSPTAVAAFKRALLDGLGQPEAVRLELEDRAYDLCLESGEADIGRASFDRVRRGEAPAWGPRKPERM